MAIELHHLQVAVSTSGDAVARRFNDELPGLDDIQKPANLKG